MKKHSHKAAAVRNKTRSDFMLEAACQEAESVLLDRRLFYLNDADYDAFESAMNAPVEDNPALREGKGSSLCMTHLLVARDMQRLDALFYD